KLLRSHRVHRDGQPESVYLYQMPAVYPPSLSYRPFQWQTATAALRSLLDTSREQILGMVGFIDEYGRPDHGLVPEPIWQQEAENLISEIAGILAKAAAIIVDAGFKSAMRVAATIRAIKRDPAMLMKEGVSIEPEALGVLALAYRELGGQPFDITGD